jgi:polyhydroxyalkanoate synthesis regulator phasin
MAQTNVLKRYLDAGMAFTAMTQSKAEALVTDLVRAGEIQTDNVQSAVAELVERSRQNTEAFLSLVSAQAESLGLATIADLNRLEKLIENVRAGGTRRARRSGGAAKKAVAKATTATKSAAKKAPAKKAAAKKTVAKKAAATKKAVAKKAPAKKTVAKKTAAKKTAAKKTAAKKTAG